MSAKEFVQNKMPKAKAERHVEGKIVGKPYWLIRDGKNTMYLASGKTQAEAWTNAKNRIIENNL
jgi:hypothetical protein